MAEDKKLKNVAVLRGFRLKGKHVPAGKVISKADFPNKGSMLNLCHMSPPKAVQTNAAVGGPYKINAERTDLVYKDDKPVRDDGKVVETDGDDSKTKKKTTPTKKKDEDGLPG